MLTSNDNSGGGGGGGGTCANEKPEQKNNAIKQNKFNTFNFIVVKIIKKSSQKNFNQY